MVGWSLLHYYLIPIYTEAPYVLSDTGLQHEEDVTIVIGVAAMCIDPRDNTVNLVASEGPTATLMARRPTSPQGQPCLNTSTTLLSRMDRDEVGHYLV